MSREKEAGAPDSTNQEKDGPEEWLDAFQFVLRKFEDYGWGSYLCLSETCKGMNESTMGTRRSKAMALLKRDEDEYWEMGSELHLGIREVPSRISRELGQHREEWAEIRQREIEDWEILEALADNSDGGYDSDGHYIYYEDREVPSPRTPRRPAYWEFGFDEDDYV